MRLTRIQADGLRGLPEGWPGLPVGGRGLVLYGPNGVGKSSVVDAIEFALKGDTTLFPNNRQGVNWAAAAPHIRASREPSVILSLRDGSVNYEIESGNSIPEAAAPWCRLAARSNFVLRRHMLLRFIDAQPSDRYSLREPFLDFSDFSEIESSFSGLERQIDGEVRAASNDLSAIEVRLGSVLVGSRASDFSDALILARLNELIEPAGVPPRQSVDELGQAAVEIRGQAARAGVAPRVAELVRLKNQIQTLPPTTSLRAALTELETAINGLVAARSRHQGPALARFLRDGRAAILDGQMSSCPLCEQAIDRAVLLPRIDERIAAEQELVIAESGVNSALDSTRRLVGPLARESAALIDGWQSTVGGPAPPGYVRLRDVAEELGRALLPHVPGARVREFAARLGTVNVGREEALGRLDREIEAESGARVNALLSAAHDVELLAENWPGYRRARSRVADARRRHALADRLHGLAINARRASVEEMLGEVSSLANQFYDQIHPDEGIATTELHVRQSQTRSIELQADFHGRSAQPLLYYSESHLDTLGLCYFLALRHIESLRAPNKTSGTGGGR